MGWPDEEAKRVKFGAAIPGLLSFLVHDDFTKPLTGLDHFPEEDWPPVALSFLTYHIMVALGLYFIAITVLAAFLRWRGTLFQSRWLLWVFVFSVVGPFIANEFGWTAAEVGRQPWVVYGLLRTEDGVSPTLAASQVLGSLIMFACIYAMLFGLWLYIMDGKIRKGPEVYAGPPGPALGRGVLGTAALLADRGGPSLTSAREKENE